MCLFHFIFYFFIGTVLNLDRIVAGVGALALFVGAYTAEIIRAVDSAVAWLQKVRLTRIRVEKVKSTSESFLRHDTDIDVVVVSDPNARPIWARHYEIGADRPVFAGRDGIKKYELAGIERERRTGTPWYGGWPASLIEREYPAWRDQRARR